MILYVYCDNPKSMIMNSGNTIVHNGIMIVLHLNGYGLIVQLCHIRIIRTYLLHNYLCTKLNYQEVKIKGGGTGSWSLPHSYATAWYPVYEVSF